MGKNQPGSWGYNALPFFEQQALHDIGTGLDFNAKKTAFIQRELMPVPTFNCPTRRRPGTVPNGYGHFPGWPAWKMINMNNLDRFSREDYAINAGDSGVCEIWDGPPSIAAAATCSMA